eukprot:363208-Chlamydomonas_euryale.AAC.3
MSTAAIVPRWVVATFLLRFLTHATHNEPHREQSIVCPLCTQQSCNKSERCEPWAHLNRQSTEIHILAVACPCRSVFGFRGDVADNIGYTDEGAIVYPAGHNVVLYQPESRTQRLISGTLDSEGITAMCVSPNKRLLAVAERAEKAMITVYDLQTLKRRKVLMSTDAGSKVRPAAARAAGHEGPARRGGRSGKSGGVAADGTTAVPSLQICGTRGCKAVSQASRGEGGMAAAALNIVAHAWRAGERHLRDAGLHARLACTAACMLPFSSFLPSLLLI